MSGMKQTADVVVIGAGIQGLSAAYHLNRAGVRDVVVVEMEVIGAGSSGRSAAMLTLQRDGEANVRMAQFAFEEYMAFESELGVSPGYERTGMLRLFGPELEDEARRHAQTRQQLNVETEVLAPDEVQARWPFVSAEGLALGVYGPDDGVLDPHSVMQGYARAARRMGTEINEGIKATGLKITNGRVAAVETTAGPIATRWAVNAAGAQAGEVGRWAGLALPIDPRRRSIFITGPFDALPVAFPMVHDDSYGWYIRREGPGILMGMGKEQAASLSFAPNWDLLPQAIDVALVRVPLMAHAEIMRGWTGLRSLTPDHKPLIGPVEGLEGLVLCCGWSGEGVTGAPAGGQLVTEVITAGGAISLPLEPFLLARFAD